MPAIMPKHMVHKMLKEVAASALTGREHPDLSVYAEYDSMLREDAEEALESVRGVLSTHLQKLPKNLSQLAETPEQQDQVRAAAIEAVREILDNFLMESIRMFALMGSDDGAGPDQS